MIFFPILPVAVKENNNGVPSADEFFVTDQTDGSQPFDSAKAEACQG